MNWCLRRQTRRLVVSREEKIRFTEFSSNSQHYIGSPDGASDLSSGQTRTQITRMTGWQQTFGGNGCNHRNPSGLNERSKLSRCA
jgi:hypothetical protein